MVPMEKSDLHAKVKGVEDVDNALPQYYLLPESSQESVLDNGLPAMTTISSTAGMSWCHDLRLHFGL